MKLSLVRALRISPSSSIAFVGAGGKSTAMFDLAKELAGTVIVTATTHLGSWQIPLADFHIVTNDLRSLENSELEREGILLVTGEIKGDRTQPINAAMLAWLHSFCRTRSIPLLIEADGSRQKPLKAWADHEPPIPEFIDHVVQVVGLSGLGKPLTDEHVHRAEKFAKLGELKPGDSITAEALIRVLTHSDGGLKNIPPDAKRSVLLNQADTPDMQSAAHTLVDDLLPHFQSILVASLENKVIHAVHEPIAGIILAAGEASRFGMPKQLLDWKGVPFVRVIAQTALRAGLSPVVVVTGAHSQQVEAAVKELDVKIVRNEDWGTGQGSSIRKGVLSLRQRTSRSAKEVGGAIFLLADQPQVGTSILHALKEKHAEGLYPIVAPMVIDRRANPVLFDRTTFSDLMHIEGDTGGRAIFHNYRVEYLPWHDDGLLLDVDTPEHYQHLISNKDL
ncbi:MAG: selenium cofactor biosynthesis protein YqeC [Anaerolineales bacterium]|nr:selenium cofactor biosynthesis protein YqeC [Anaerolineales bacterium]